MVAMMANASPGGCLRQPDRHASNNELFFTMAFTLLFPLDKYGIEYSESLLPGADYYVTSCTCTTLNGMNTCGSDDYTASFKVVAIPEPGSWSLLALGFLGTALFKSRSKLLDKTRDSAAAGA